MKKNVLVIGGSYFAGRVFCINISKGDKIALHVVNRGTYTLNLPGVCEYKCDRHDVEKLSKILPDIKFDAVIDFCGYIPGEISAIINLLLSRTGQYIFISTSSVYVTTGVKKESSPLVEEEGTDPISEYISYKIKLEHELKDACASMGIPYTIVRPTFIYGPYNYVPRESYFIQQILKGLFVPELTDASAKFSMVYVLDLARALELFVGNNKAYNEEFNLAGVEEVTYTSLLSELERCYGAPFPKQPVTVSQVIAENIPLPFPLDEDDLCSGEKMTQRFGFEYTSFSAGMDKTFTAFKAVFS
ncbi:MAG: NAD-dependent epimerase/dehydratase family protein [Pseudomonadota bacterium]